MIADYMSAMNFTTSIQSPALPKKLLTRKIRIMDFEKEKVAFLRLALIQHYIPTKSIRDLTRP